MRRETAHLREHHDENGFGRFEFVVVMLLVTAIVLVISFSFSKVTSSATKSACASDVSMVDQAASNFSSLNPTGTQVTVAALTTTTDAGTATLSSWPKAPGHAYLILIAGDGNGLVGQTDARGVPIRRNDILVVVGTRAFDATRSFATACSAA